MVLPYVLEEMPRQTTTTTAERLSAEPLIIQILLGLSIIFAVFKFTNLYVSGLQTQTRSKRGLFFAKLAFEVFKLGKTQVSLNLIENNNEELEQLKKLNFNFDLQISNEPELGSTQIGQVCSPATASPYSTSLPAL